MSFRLGFLTHVQGRGDDLARTYRNAQDLFVVADELGFDAGWVAQHHVPLGGGGLPSPWTFLAHAAARTKRIRLGTAITILPLEDPVRLAEDISVVDTLSGGRVEVGVGSGGSEVEYAAFGRDVARKRELTTENRPDHPVQPRRAGSGRRDTRTRTHRDRGRPRPRLEAPAGRSVR